MSCPKIVKIAGLAATDDSYRFPLKEIRLGVETWNQNQTKRECTERKCKGERGAKFFHTSFLSARIAYLGKANWM